MAIATLDSLDWDLEKAVDTHVGGASADSDAGDYSTSIDVKRFGEHSDNGFVFM